MARGSTFSMLYTRTNGGTIFAANDQAEWQNILNNLDPSGIGSYLANTTEMQATSNPAPGGTPSVATSLLGWMQQVHYQLAGITGNSYWYQAAPVSLTAWSTDTGAADAYVVTLAPVPTWAAGLRFYTQITHANATTTPTVNPNSLGAKTIVRPDGSAVVAGDLPLNWMAIFEYYDATHAALLNPATIPMASVSGTISTAQLNLDKCRLYLNAAMTGVTTATGILFDTASWDTNSIADIVTNKGRITPKKAGKYRVYSTAEWNGNATCTLWVYKNGAAKARSTVPVNNVAAQGISVSDDIDCNGSTDYIEIFGSAGASMTINAGSSQTYVTIVGPF